MNEPSKSELKKKLRAQALRQRRQISAGSDTIDQIIARFEPLLEPYEQAEIAAYWPVNGELDLTPLVSHYASETLRFCLPRIAKGDLTLTFARWNDQTRLEPGDFGIMEPIIESAEDKIMPDIFLVPLLAFDRQGMRLGYGGGYYDKTLAVYKKEKPITSIGVAYDEQTCLFPLPREDHDEVLDYIITPSQTYNFTKG